MQSKSDQQLAQIVGSKREEYQPLAILAAEQELAQRNVNPDLLEENDIFGEEQAPTKSTQGFEWYHKAGMLLLPFFIVGIYNLLTSLLSMFVFVKVLGFPFIFLCYYWLHYYLKTNGYDRMAKDFKSWTNYTLYIYIGILIVGIVLLLAGTW